LLGLDLATPGRTLGLCGGSLIPQPGVAFGHQMADSGRGSPLEGLSQEVTKEPGNP